MHGNGELEEVGMKEATGIDVIDGGVQMLANQCLRKNQNIWLALIENRPPPALKDHLWER